MIENVKIVPLEWIEQTVNAKPQSVFSHDEMAAALSQASKPTAKAAASSSKTTTTTTTTTRKTGAKRRRASMDMSLPHSV
jgi:hypothetical protein